MLIKKIFLMIVLSFIHLNAHNVAGVDMSVKKLDNDKIEVKVFYQKSKKALSGNEVRLISMFDNRVLQKAKLEKKGLILDIPKESYWVYVMLRDNDIVKDGLAPTNGFTKTIKKENLALKYSIIMTTFFLFLSLFFAYKRNKRFKQTLL